MAKKNWIAGAINPEHKGSLRKALHAKKGEQIPEAKLEKAAKGKGSMAKKARLAETLKSFHKK